MSTRHVGWALYGDHPGHLDATSRLILVVLADHAGTDGVAWPSLARIAELTGTSRDTVRRRLLDLHEAELIGPAHPDDTPAGWHQQRADRRPAAWQLRPATGSQPATPSPARGSSRATSQTGHGVAGETPRGSKSGGHGVAAVLPEPRTEPRTEPSGVTNVGDSPRAAARDEPPQALARGRPEPPPAAPPGPGPADRHPSAVVPCRMCRNVHPPDTPHPRRQPPEVAQRGAARARAALAGGAAGGDP
jgi:hypothetical protein